MESKYGEWHSMSRLERFMTRYVMKVCAHMCVGLAWIANVIPGVGHVLVALLTGWVVAWETCAYPGGYARRNGSTL